MEKNKKMNKKKRKKIIFFRRLILLLIILLVIFGLIFKFIKKDMKISNNIDVKTETLKEKINEEDIKKKKILKKNAEEKVLKEEIQEEIENKTEKEEIKKEKFLNVSAKTYLEIGDKNYVQTLRKGTRVKILENSFIEKKVKNDSSEEKAIKIPYSKVIFKDVNGEKEVWIRDKFLTANRKDILPEKINDIEIIPREKLEYGNNKRVKVRGIYVSSKTVTLKKRLDELIELSKANNINAFVIDVKEDHGKITFPVSEQVRKYSETSNKNVDIKDIDTVMKKLKENNIYTIARIVSFKDSIYAKENPNKIITYKATGKAFTKKDNLTWVSPHDRGLWEYNIFIAKEAAKAGFNEIQFDYVRFPASNGGKLDKELDYKNSKNESKARTIQKYLEYAKKELEEYQIYVSADVYGQVGSVSDDMSLGQYCEAISSEADYICPMMYPSHYGRGVYGLAIPDANPYKTIYNSTKDFLNRNNNIENPAIIRPWIQAFTANWIKGHITYGPQQIREQVQALKDLGVEEYILWSPTNRYESYF